MWLSVDITVVVYACLSYHNDPLTQSTQHTYYWLGVDNSKLLVEFFFKKFFPRQNFPAGSVKHISKKIRHVYAVLFPSIKRAIAHW